MMSNRSSPSPLSPFSAPWALLSSGRHKEALNSLEVARKSFRKLGSDDDEAAAGRYLTLGRVNRALLFYMSGNSFDCARLLDVRCRCGCCCF